MLVTISVLLLLSVGLLPVGLLRLDTLWGRGGSSRLSVSRSLYSSSVNLVAQLGDG